VLLTGSRAAPCACNARGGRATHAGSERKINSVRSSTSMRRWRGPERGLWGLGVDRLEAHSIVRLPGVAGLIYACQGVSITSHALPRQCKQQQLVVAAGKSGGGRARRRAATGAARHAEHGQQMLQPRSAARSSPPNSRHCRLEVGLQ
jgi:hypothetical protein